MKFEFSIGGYTGNSYALQLKNSFLTCNVRDYGYPESNCEEVSVLITNNTDFTSMLAYLKTRKWKRQYLSEGVLDGTQWELKLILDTIQITSGGSNKFPPGFFKFLKLLNNIIRETGVVVR